uniref:CCHC-type domain-containing protein n=1 Tax=Hyaloperonospora arabidopsidis (strain Emoy2) TaxID=559515 RepID=M4B328_HYAAE
MVTRDYVQMARHLASCIIPHPMYMYTQVNVFVDGMREGQTRLSLERAEPTTLEEAFAIALCEDVRVTKAYTKPSVVTVARPSGPEPMEIDGIESSGGRRRVAYYIGDARTGRQMFCFRCRKPGHRAAECRAPAPISAQGVSVHHEDAAPPGRPTTAGTRRCVGSSGSHGGSPTFEPSCAARLNATTTIGDSRLIFCQLACHRCPATFTSTPGLRSDEQFLS